VAGAQAHTGVDVAEEAAHRARGPSRLRAGRRCWSMRSGDPRRVRGREAAHLPPGVGKCQGGASAAPLPAMRWRLDFGTVDAVHPRRCPTPTSPSRRWPPAVCKTVGPWCVRLGSLRPPSRGALVQMSSSPGARLRRLRLVMRKPCANDGLGGMREARADEGNAAVELGRARLAWLLGPALRSRLRPAGQAASALSVAAAEQPRSRRSYGVQSPSCTIPSSPTLPGCRRRAARGNVPQGPTPQAQKRPT
jgi:hypothetical protein